MTSDDLSNRKQYLNSRNTLLTLLSWGVVPIINENDTVAVEEIKLGDNDNLAAMITLLMDAGLLINLTDIDGLYTTADGQTTRDAKMFFDSAGKMDRLLGFRKFGRGAPRAITPRLGDHFTPFAQALVPSRDEAAGWQRERRNTASRSGSTIRSFTRMVLPANSGSSKTRILPPIITGYLWSLRQVKVGFW